MDGSDFNFDDAYRLRERQDDANVLDSIPRGQTGAGAPCAVLQTYAKTAYPTSAASFYACKAADVFGTETEGAAGTIVTGSSPIYALNLGSAVPPSGTNLLAVFVEFRWVFRYDG